jgi:hypothetical protein
MPPGGQGDPVFKSISFNKSATFKDVIAQLFMGQVYSDVRFADEYGKVIAPPQNKKISEIPEIWQANGVITVQLVHKSA